MLGAGWSVTTAPTAHAIAILLKIPWDRASQKIHFALRLMDGDGHPVALTGASGPVAILHEMDVEVGRPPGVAPGSLLDASMAINVHPLPLGAGRYEWRLEYDDTSKSASFEVRIPRRAGAVEG
jgi:hypothetical protein